MMQEALFLRLRDGPPLSRVDALAPDGKRVTLSTDGSLYPKVFTFTHEETAPALAIDTAYLFGDDPAWMRTFRHIYYVGRLEDIWPKLAGYRLAPPPCPKRKENSRT